VASSPLGLSPASPTYLLSSGGAQSSAPVAAAGAGGAVAAVWIESLGGHNLVVGAENSMATPGHGNGGFSVPAIASSTVADASMPGLAVLNNGTMVTAYDVGANIIGNARQGPNGSASDPGWANTSGGDPIEASCFPDSPPTLGVDGQNATTVVYDCAAVPRRLRMVTRPPGGAFSAPSTVVNGPDAGADSDVEHLDVAPDGSAVLAWDQQTATDQVVRAAVRAPGAAPGAFGHFKTLAPGVAIAAGVAQGGNGFVFVDNVRTTVSGSPVFADVLYYDGQPPKVAVQSAGLAFAGQPVTLRAPSSDSFSHVASVRWSFGDGTTGAGAAVDHVFAHSGKFVVKATARDSSGNAASATRTVRVYAADTTPPKLKITSGKAKVRKGRARIKVACGGERFVCDGTLTLARKGKRAGRAPFVIRGGRQAAVSVKLSKAARKALASSGKLKVAATAKGQDAAGNAAKVTRGVTLRG
jgi:hypothetical protein